MHNTIDITTIDQRSRDLLGMLEKFPPQNQDEIAATVERIQLAWSNKDIQLLCIYSGFLVEQITILVHEFKGIGKRKKNSKYKQKEFLAALGPLSTQQLSWDDSITRMKQWNLTFGNNSTVDEMVDYVKTVFKFRNLAAHPNHVFKDIKLTEARDAANISLYLSYCALHDLISLRERVLESVKLEVFIREGRLFTGLLMQKFSPRSLDSITETRQFEIGKALGRRASYSTYNAYFEGIYPAANFQFLIFPEHFWLGVLQGLFTYFTDQNTMRIDYTSVSVTLNVFCSNKVRQKSLTKVMTHILTAIRGIKEAWLFSGDKQKTVSSPQQYLYDRLKQTSQHFPANSKANHQFERLAINIAIIKKIT